MQLVLLVALLAAQTGDVESLYLRGLAAAADAYTQGGSEESLAPVREAIDRLQAISRGRAGSAEIARLVLVAAAAAAQSEREEMGAYLTHATDMELLQLAAGEPPAPGIPALVAAGDLWLQVHRFEEAVRAYERAASHFGMTPRIAAGLAKARR